MDIPTGSAGPGCNQIMRVTHVDEARTGCLGRPLAKQALLSPEVKAPSWGCSSWGFMGVEPGTKGQGGQNCRQRVWAHQKPQTGPGGAWENIVRGPRTQCSGRKEPAETSTQRRTLDSSSQRDTVAPEEGRRLVIGDGRGQRLSGGS